MQEREREASGGERGESQGTNSGRGVIAMAGALAAGGLLGAACAGVGTPGAGGLGGAGAPPAGLRERDDGEPLPRRAAGRGRRPGRAAQGLQRPLPPAQDGAALHPAGHGRQAGRPAQRRHPAGRLLHRQRGGRHHPRRAGQPAGAGAPGPPRPLRHERLLRERLALYQLCGKQYAYPLDFPNQELYYNAELFDQAGVKAPPADWNDTSWTFDRFLDAARRRDRRDRGARSGATSPPPASATGGSGSPPTGASCSTRT